MVCNPMTWIASRSPVPQVRQRASRRPTSRTRRGWCTEFFSGIRPHVVYGMCHSPAIRRCIMTKFLDAACGSFQLRLMYLYLNGF